MRDLSFIRWLEAPARPWSSWTVDAVIVAYALWTVACHAVTLFGGNTYALAWTVGAIAVLAGLTTAYFVRATRKRATSSEHSTQAGAAEQASAPAVEPEGAARAVWIQHAVLGLAAIAVLGLWLLKVNALYKWIALCAYLVLALVLELRRPITQWHEARSSRWQQAALWALALFSAWLALYFHRWRNDDCFYINMAVTIVDVPHAPLLTVSSVHAPGEDGALQKIFAPYRVHSFEALGGFIAFITGAEAIKVIHIWMAGISALMIPLGIARLFQLLDARRWLPMVFAAYCIYLFEGSSGVGYGSHGFVRAFTGKSVLLSAGMPILVYYGITFARTPTWGRWLMLLAAQITAVGLTSTALWLAPTTAMLAVLVPLQLDKRALRVCGLALLSCLYVLALALWIRELLPDSMMKLEAGSRAAKKAAEGWVPHFGLMYWWLKKMFGTDPVANRYLALLVVAIAVARTSPMRRYLVIFSAALALAFMNPYFGNFVRFNIAGRWTGERVLYLLPIAAIVGAAFCSMLPDRRGLGRQALGALGALAALVAFFAMVPERPVLKPLGAREYSWPPAPKVPTQAFEIVNRVTALQLGDRQVLAPEIVSWFLPTVHGHPYPVLANAKYLSAPESEKKRRKRLIDLVSKRKGALNTEKRSELKEELEHYRVGAVVLTKAARRTPGLTDTLKDAGFVRGKGNGTYDLWRQR